MHRRHRSCGTSQAGLRGSRYRRGGLPSEVNRRKKKGRKENSLLLTTPEKEGPKPRTGKSDCENRQVRHSTRKGSGTWSARMKNRGQHNAAREGTYWGKWIRPINNGRENRAGNSRTIRPPGCFQKIEKTRNTQRKRRVRSLQKKRKGSDLCTTKVLVGVVCLVEKRGKHRGKPKRRMWQD